MSQCFHYATTKDPSARSNALSAFAGMEFLYKVTGIRGLMARTFAHSTDPHLEKLSLSVLPWINSTTEPGWIWQGDTSSDQVTGHMFVYHVFYDLVAETPDEKKRAFQMN